jgi:hypothetical protein
MDDDEESSLSRTESSLSEYKSMPPTPGGMDQYRAMSREQSKLAPHTMKMNLPPPTQQELNDNAAALQRLQQVAGYALLLLVFCSCIYHMGLTRNRL